MDEFEMYESGMSTTDISRETGISETTLLRRFKKAGITRSRSEALELAAKQGKLGRKPGGIPHNKLDLIGKQFSRVFVIREVELRKFKSGNCTQYLCRCDCGTEFKVLGSSLTSGNTKSCGCYARELVSEKSRKHGMHGTRTYRIWQAMLNRCRNKNVPNYNDYGGRGVTVCDEWLSFENFFEDMGEPLEDQSIDRIDNNGDYELNNCKWSTMKEQGRNKRNNRIIELNGKSMCLAAWAEELNIDQASLRERLDRWPKEIALTKPKRTIKKEN